uniref:ACC1 n=1 Tax=Arundo donax TaxID=35708 RepID=A0A0A9DKE4_ARUDO
MLISCKDHSSSIQTCSISFVYLARGSNRRAHCWETTIKWFSSLHSRRVIKIQPCYKITSLQRLALRHHNMNDTRSR